MTFTLKTAAAVLITAAVINLFSFCSLVLELDVGEQATLIELSVARIGTSRYRVSLFGKYAVINIQRLQTAVNEISSVYGSAPHMDSSLADASKRIFD